MTSRASARPPSNPERRIPSGQQFTSSAPRPRGPSHTSTTNRSTAGARNGSAATAGGPAGPNANANMEKRIERNTSYTKETVSVRTRSPVKTASQTTTSGSAAKRRKEAERQDSVPAPVTGQAKAEEPWLPQVSLIPHTTAPLASRISAPPLASRAPSQIQPKPLSSLSSDAQEKAIIEDLLFVFMGFEGQYICFDESYNPLEEKDRLIGPQFRMPPGIDPSLNDLATSMLSLATHYVAVEAFVEVQSREEFGAVNHALCAAVRKLLKEYLVLIAQLEHQMLTNPTFTLHILNLHTKSTSLMMLQLYNMGLEVLKANSVLEDDSDDSLDDTDNLEDILETLREGGNIGSGGLAGKKVCKGGSVLCLITKRLASMSGDPAARTLYTTLLREASRPYMSMLNEWLHHGGIKDPHAEFLIKEQKSIKRERLDQDYTDEYWEKRYTIRDNLVPPQLESVKDKVLLAGKYLNVVRECGGIDVSKVVKDVPTTLDDPNFLENVNAAYAHANSSLLDLLLTTHALPARLRSLKHYFFLDRSDFFTYFLELSTSELRKPAKIVNIGKLQSLLDIVLRQPGSVAAEDPYKEDVKVVMNEHGLTNWLMKVVNVTGIDHDAATGSFTNYVTPAATSEKPTSITDDSALVGFDALVLDYTVPFPLSLVVSRVALTRYQILFRFLLSLRHLETLLIGAWTDHSKVRAWNHKSSDRRIEMWKRRAWTLRARMLIFIQQLLYYCTSEVVEPNWQVLMSRLSTGSADRPASSTGVGANSADPGSSAGTAADAFNPKGQVKRTVDELMQDHVDFLATCLKECMLTNSKLLRINSKILGTCTMFANFTSSLSRYLTAADPDLSSPASATNNASSSATTRPSASAGHKRNAASTIAAAATAASANNAVPPHDPAKFDKLADILHKYEDNFERHLKVLLDTLNYLAATETVVFLSLCARLSTAASEGFAGGGVGLGDEA